MRGEKASYQLTLITNLDRPFQLSILGLHDGASKIEARCLSYPEEAIGGDILAQDAHKLRQKANYVPLIQILEIHATKSLR